MLPLDVETIEDPVSLAKDLVSRRAVDGCWVCGELKANHCSRCLSFGLKIRFCSTEPQKLVWPYHRKVCGQRSTPFQPPNLTEEEIQRLIDNKQHNMSPRLESNPNIYDPSDFNPADIVSLSIVKAADLPPGSFEMVFVPLAREGLPLEPAIRRFTLFEAHTYFNILDQRALLKPGLEEGSWATHVSDWNGRADAYELEDPVGDSRYNPWLHRALIAYTIARAAMDSLNESSYRDFLRHAIEQLVLASTEGREFSTRDAIIDHAAHVIDKVHDVACIRTQYSIQLHTTGVYTLIGLTCRVEPTCTHKY
ncbi:hypothetical protein NBRC10513v2_003516 [Rhodotorula toruloides]